VINITSWPLYPREKSPTPMEQEVGWAPELVWMIWKREKSLVLAWIQTPVQPACSLLTTSKYYINSKNHYISLQRESIILKYTHCSFSQVKIIRTSHLMSEEQI
jgi:hypothetical protein